MVVNFILFLKAGYVDAFKEAQRRKSKGKPIYTIEDYRKYEPNFSLGKDLVDETDTDKVCLCFVFFVLLLVI